VLYEKNGNLSNAIEDMKVFVNKIPENAPKPNTVPVNAREIIPNDPDGKNRLAKLKKMNE
jgi:hypothetical protein